MEFIVENRVKKLLIYIIIYLFIYLFVYLLIISFCFFIYLNKINSLVMLTIVNYVNYRSKLSQKKLFFSELDSLIIKNFVQN